MWRIFQKSQEIKVRNNHWLTSESFKLRKTSLGAIINEYLYERWAEMSLPWFPHGTVLSNHVVSAETVNTFKNRWDKFRLDQEVLYDYKTDLHGVGNRSIV